MASIATLWTIELAPGTVVSVRVFAGGEAWRVLHFHGGAFGGPAGSDAVASTLAAAGATIYSIDYPCGRAHPFPEAIETAYRAVACLAAKRGGPILVAGEEAGGNLAAGLALMCRDRLRPRLAGQILLSPMLDPRLGTGSARAAEAGLAGCKWSVGWSAYLPTPERAAHPYAAPAMALRLGGVAPALLVTGPNDPMADETAAYAARLRASGVPAVERRIEAGAAWPEALASAAADPPWATPLEAAVRAFFHTCHVDP